MDGKEMLYRLRQLINEGSSSGFLDTKTTYDVLNEAARELVNRTACLTTTQAITTVANQQTYNLSPDFLKLSLKNSSNDYFIKFNDGTTDYFVTFDDYSNIIFRNNTTASAIPNKFSIIDALIIASLSGSATSTNSVLTGNESTLDSTTSNFTNVSVGDIVHNTTDGSDGIVIAVNSTTELITSLYNGTNNYWTSGDAYVIQPQGRLQLVLEPIPSNSGNTITVYYAKRPPPVYSSYRIFGTPSQYDDALLKYAAFLYKYRDRQPNFGDKYYVMFDNEVRKNSNNINLAFQRTGFRVNLKKRR